MEDIILGLYNAIEVEGPKGERKFGGRLIMSFLRDWKVDNEDQRNPADPAFTGFPSAMDCLE